MAEMSEARMSVDGEHRTPKEEFETIPFNDDADEPKTWRGIALSAISDMYHYAEDIDPARRYVSANAYAEDAIRVAAQNDRAKVAQRAAIMDAIERFMDPSHFDHDGGYLHCPDANRGFHVGDLADAVLGALEQHTREAK